jgi:hypothetical protein
MRFTWPFNSTGLILRGKPSDILARMPVKGFKRADGEQDKIVVLWWIPDRRKGGSGEQDSQADVAKTRATGGRIVRGNAQHRAVEMDDER